MATVVDRRNWIGVEAGPLPLKRLLSVPALTRGLIAAVVSTAIGTLFALPTWSQDQWKMYLAEWWAWALLLPLIMFVDRWIPFPPNELRRRVLAHVAAGIVFVGAYLYLFFALWAALRSGHWSDLSASHMFVRGNLGWYLWSALIYAMIVGALQAYAYYRRFVSSELQVERLERNYTEARLNALRMQLDPHFLFNALNTISSHVERDPRLTRRMIEHLGDLLRMSLETKDRQEVPLAEELEFLEHYLEIQRIRFGSQLSVKVQAEPEVRYAMTPSLVLQPLVENAIRHGISKRASGGEIVVSARAEEGRLVLRVEDDGAGLPAGWTLEQSAGLGLSVTRERVEALYGDDGALTVRRRKEGGTVVELKLPLRRSGDDSDDGA
jgi:signal transduction histidine kinase